MCIVSSSTGQTQTLYHPCFVHRQVVDALRHVFAPVVIEFTEKGLIFFILILWSYVITGFPVDSNPGPRSSMLSSARLKWPSRGGLGPLSFIRPKVLTSCIDESNYGFRSYEVVQDRMKMVYRLTKKTVNIEYGYRSTYKT